MSQQILSPLAIVVAMDQRRAIGLQDRLPWKPIKADLNRFKTITTTGSRIVLVGRKTHESIFRRLGKPLPERKTIILTRNCLYYFPPSFYGAFSLEAGMILADTLNEERKEIFVIGGAEIYALALPLASRIYLTRVEGLFETDTFFPPFDENEWEIIEKQDPVYDRESRCDYQFLTLERRKRDAADTTI